MNLILPGDVRVEDVIDTASGLKVNFISREDLMAAKLAAGRPQDLADVVAIQKAGEKERQKAPEAETANAPHGKSLR